MPEDSSRFQSTASRHPPAKLNRSVQIWLAADHEAKLEKVVTFGAVKGKIGEVIESAGGKIVITSQSGRIHVFKAKLGDGKKVNGDALGIAAGTILGS